jgi:hypothetical protein
MMLRLRMNAEVWHAISPTRFEIDYLLVLPPDLLEKYFVLLEAAHKRPGHSAEPDKT